jgi:hypothetical protein
MTALRRLRLKKSIRLHSGLPGVVPVRGFGNSGWLIKRKLPHAWSVLPGLVSPVWHGGTNVPREGLGGEESHPPSTAWRDECPRRRSGGEESHPPSSIEPRSMALSPFRVSAAAVQNRGSAEIRRKRGNPDSAPPTLPRLRDSRTRSGRRRSGRGARERRQLPNR